MKNFVKYLAVPVVAGSLLGVSALADTGHIGAEGAATSGTVSAVNGNSVTITVSDASKIKIGDLLSVIDRSIAEANRAIVGKVTATGSGSFTVQQRNGSTVTVNTSSSTTVSKGRQSATLSDIVAGAMVRIKGAFDAATSTIAASSINIVTKVNAGLRLGRGQHELGQSPSPTPTH